MPAPHADAPPVSQPEVLIDLSVRRHNATTPRGRRRRQRVMVVAAALALILGGAAGYAVVGNPRPGGEAVPPPAPELSLPPAPEFNPAARQRYAADPIRTSPAAR